MQELIDRLKSFHPTISEILAISGSPGLSLGVLHNGNVLHTAHFGRRDLSDPSPPDDDTVYYVASLTKILTACLVAMLVEDGVLSWDTPVREYLPIFKQRTDEIGLKATLVDLLSNRTGLAAATNMWGQQYGQSLFPQSEVVHQSCYLEAAKPFRKSFLYSQWNYALAAEVVERTTGESLGVTLQKRLLNPLNMLRTTMEYPARVNVAVPYAIDNTGMPCRISAPDIIDGKHGLVGGAGAKSTTKDLLILYKSLLSAFTHQTSSDSNSTPGSPFKQLRTVFFPHIGLGNTTNETIAYCLGLYRTRLPMNLGFASINSLFFGLDKIPSTTGSSSPGLQVYHHTANLPGFFASAFLIPSSESAIVVMTNSFPLLDVTDFAGQSIISLLLGEKPLEDVISLSESVRSASLASYARMNGRLENRKTGRLPQLPFSAFEGDYINRAGNFVLSVIARRGGLLMKVQPPSQTCYDLLPYDRNTFYWPADREAEICKRGMWPFLSLGWHQIVFGASDDGTGIEHLTWAHDLSARPETFRKRKLRHGVDVAKL
ncbi:hypothetical protein MMC27_008323 [Xylographa pallens]|nr:hypothetical protein [Xylographa pallens]